ncbi:MAG: DUF5723 family protein [Bacteroidia bacterium]
MKNQTLLLLVIALLLVNTAFSQQNFTLYNMEKVSQRMNLNPAFKPSHTFLNIGIPVLSSQYINVNNSGFKYSDLIKHRADDSLYMDYNNMLSKLKKKNYISMAYQTELISFGIALPKSFLSFNVTEKINFRFRYPKAFMEFIWKGNGEFLNQDMNFNFGVSLMHYREYGLGYVYDINDKLTIGGKIKYLYGMENVYTERSAISMYTNANDFAITAKSDVLIHTSGVNSASTKNIQIGNYAFNRNNHGMGLDIGAVYKLNEKIALSLSVIDMGAIKWKNATDNYISHNPNATFTYKGFDISKLINNDSTNAKDAFKSLTDSLTQVFKIDTLHHSYSTNLSSQIYIGGNYSLTEKSNVGVLLYGQVLDKVIHPGVAFSFNQKVGEWFSVSASYSMYNRSYTNIGLGTAFNLGPVQLYIITDNVMGVLFPQNTKNLHFQGGIQLTFGKKSAKAATPAAAETPSPPKPAQ